MPASQDFRPVEPPYIQPEETPVDGGPGCAVWGCIGVAGVGLAVVIVLLAAAAGWTAGRRTADANATATKSVEINEQLNRIPQDIQSGNLMLANNRLRFLAIMTPGVPGLPELAQTATAAYIDSLPTATPTPTETPEATEAAEEIDEFVMTPAGDEGPTYDLAAMLEEAARDVNTGRFEEGYDLLDVIMAIDPNYERARVRQLLTTALNGQARALFNSSSPAQGIIWASRAEDLGVIEGDVSYEMYAALEWQEAQAAVGLSFPQAVNALQQVINMGQGRYYEQARQLLFQQYMGWGDALALDPTQGYCPAVTQYQNAVNVFNDPAAIAKRDNASSMCAQATPTLGPEMTPGLSGVDVTPGAPPPSGQIAPVGQPGT